MEWIKVFIVDDLVFVWQVFIEMFLWDVFIDVVGVVLNLFVVCEMIKVFNLDVLMFDIEMLCMDGL